MADALIDVLVDGLSAQGAGNLGLRLVRADGGALPGFSAGAHVDLHLPNGLVRQYSIASGQDRLDRYVLCVRREAASRGGSAWLHGQVRLGQALRISAPRNLFALQPASGYLLLAGGIGITPLLSMAQALDRQGTGFELHYYVQEPAHAAFGRRLRAGFAHGQVHLHAASEGGDARTALPAALQAPDPQARVYLCGPYAFMEHVTSAALASGWDASRIHREAFAAPPAPPTAADQAGFEVQIASTGQLVHVAGDCSIAQALSAAGVPVSLSCEMGMCGACLTGVLAGEPDHRDSVLNAAEHAANDQMTVCCSRSRSPRLVLDL